MYTEKLQSIYVNFIRVLILLTHSESKAYTKKSIKLVFILLMIYRYGILLIILVC
jgi:hypothetical protein